MFLFPPQGMKIVTLNVRGLLDKKKRAHLYRYLKGLKCDIFLLQETHCSSKKDCDDFSWQWCQRRDRPYCKFTIFRAPDSGAPARGVAVMLNPRSNVVFVPERDLYDSEGRFLAACVREGILTYNVCSVYAPNDLRERAGFFSRLALSLIDWAADVPVSCDSAWLLGGDFNLACDPDLDRLVRDSGDANRSDRAAFAELCASLGVVDQWRARHPTDRRFTWTNAASTQAARLDLFLTPVEADAVVDLSEPYLSGLDHRAVVVRLNEPAEVRRGPGYWMLNVSLLSDDDYVALVQSHLAEAVQEIRAGVYPDLRTGWDALKARVRAVSRRYAKQLEARKDCFRHDLLEAIEGLEAALPDAPGEVAPMLAQLRLDLAALELDRLEGAAVRSRARWREEGERPTAYFCRLEKARAAKSSIAALRTPSGQRVTDLEKLPEVAASFYRRLYTPDTPTDAEAIELMLEQLDADHEVAQVDADELEKHCTMEELLAALKRTASHRSPGEDGLPYEFYRVFWEQIGPLLLEVIKESFARGKLPRSCRTGVIKLLYKKGDKEDLRNWRPLSMLNCDYKLAASVLASRLGRVAGQLIYTEQTGFIKGRNIGENVLLMQSVLDLEHKSGCVLMLDQEKAYDRVSWGFIDRALDNYGFGPTFKRAVSALYTGARSKVFVNGFMSESFPLQRSVRQGDPLSPLLYNLVDNYLAAALLNDYSIRGLPIRGPAPHPKICLSQYADDKAIFCGGAGDLQRVAYWLYVQ